MLKNAAVSSFYSYKLNHDSDLTEQNIALNLPIPMLLFFWVSASVLVLNLFEEINQVSASVPEFLYRSAKLEKKMHATEIHLL